MTAVKTAVTLLIVCFPLLTSAQGNGGGSACRADAQRFCVQSSGAENIRQCLIDHQKEISDGCYDLLKAQLSQQQGGGGVNACKADVSQYCKGGEKGGGRIINCLIDHQKDISDGCYDFLKKQKSGGSASGSGGSNRAAEPTRPIYRSQQAGGRTVYSDVPQFNATAQEKVPVVRQ